MCVCVRVCVCVCDILWGDGIEIMSKGPGGSAGTRLGGPRPKPKLCRLTDMGDLDAWSMHARIAVKIV